MSCGSLQVAQHPNPAQGDEFDFEQYQKNYTGRCIPLFAIDPKKRLHVFVENGSLKPESDWTVISLIQSENDIAKESVQI